MSASSFVPRRDSEDSALLAESKPITLRHIILGVFAGMWAYTLTAAVVYALIRTVF